MAKTERPEPQFAVTTIENVPYRRVADLLCSAFEGGSNYWIDRVTKHKPPEWKYLCDPDLGRDPGSKPSIWLSDYVMNEGGKLVFTINEPFDDDDTTEYTLDLEKLQKGLATFLQGRGWGKDTQGQEKIHLTHAHNFLRENDDAETGDVFLQICLFGEVIFG